MIDEPDNVAAAATDNVTTQADDTAPDWDYYDPDEDQDTEETPAPDATDDGAADAEEATETADEPAEVEAPLDAVVVLADGTKAKVADLAQGYLRQQDYSRKTQEVANDRKALQANVQRLEQTVQVFVDHLTGLVPEPPPPSLALTNPNAYTARKAQYEAALSEVQKLVEIGQTPKELAGSLTKEDRSTLVAEENRKLAEAIPETATAQGRQKFFTEAAATAGEYGFTMEELGQVTDHRLFVLLADARLGRQSKQAQKVAAQKVAKAPPVAPRKPGQAVAQNGNAEAMKRLNRSGSIKDALKIDWD